MQEKVRSHDWDRSVRWIDEWLPPGEVAALFNLADLYISIPRGDLLAMTVLEGMACGCFPVLADLSAYCKHAPIALGAAGDNAEIIAQPSPEKLAGAINRVLADAPRRAAAGQFNAARMRRDEDASRNMARIEDIYAAAIEGYARH
jgi:glycosyltransferase involved in cell wall biosynthesis